MSLSQLKNISKSEWKRFVHRNVKLKNEDDLLLSMKGYKKINLEEICKEECEIKPYIKDSDLSSGVMRFKIKSSMRLIIKMSFMSDTQFSQELGSVGKTDAPN